MNNPGFLVTVASFASLGYVVSRSLRPTWQIVLLLALGALVGGWIGVNTSLLSVFGFTLPLNWALRSLCLGLLAGVLLRSHPAVAS